jgi:hypothetical protein|tara:strand:- start:436 stop:1332 length:897 start_codon:yes stop_codon:yes gene_type:complete
MHNMPFALPGRFYKGNLHAHCTCSDGDHSVDEVICRYQEQGYDFLALSDHFLECHGYPVTDTRAFRSKDFTTLIAAELHAGKILNGELWHVLAVGLPLGFFPLGQGEDIVGLARRAFESGAFIGILHPVWYGLQPEDARILPFAHAIEVYNHGAEMENGRGDGWGLCDILLNEGRHLHGFAADDAHYLAHDAFGGWVQVKAPNLDPRAILESLKAGAYYSSQGPQIDDIRIEGNEVAVECSPASTIMICGRGSRADKVMGEGLQFARLPLARFQRSHFRITVIDDAGRKAWSNPVWLQ